MAEGAATCRLAAAVERLEPAPKKVDTVGAAELNTTARRRSAAATLVSMVFARQTRVTAMVWLIETIQGALRWVAASPKATVVLVKLCKTSVVKFGYLRW